MLIWEYTTLLMKRHDTLEAKLNEHGKEGWELVQVLEGNKETPMLIFKRPIED